MKRANRKIKYLNEIKLNANIQNSREPKTPLENMLYNIKRFMHIYIEHAYTRAQSIYI
jgi:hypothetical protein